MYEWGKEEEQAIVETLRSGRLFRYQGPGVETQSSRFEKSLAEKMEHNHAIAVTSGTDALVAALSACGIGPGDEVIIPAFTFFATAAAVTRVQAIPVIANIDEFLSLDVEELDRLCGPRTKAVIPVHMDGLACDMGRIMDFARKKNLYVIEDVAQSIGGSFKGKPLGSLGDFGCYSFNVDKIISCGEGGAVCTSSEELYLKSLCAHDACAPFGWSLKEKFSNGAPFIGESMRISELSAAMLGEQLKRLDKIIEKLRTRKKIVQKILQEHGLNYRQAHCPEGDCGTSLHLVLDDPMQVLFCAKKMISVGIKAIPIQARPAHAVWQWSHMLQERRFRHPGLDPFRHSEEIYDYSKANFLKSYDILLSTLKLPIEYNLSEDETRDWALKVVENIK